MIIVLIKPVVDALLLLLHYKKRNERKMQNKTKPVHLDHTTMHGGVDGDDDKEELPSNGRARTSGLRSKGQNQFGLLFKTSPAP